jgi:peptidoglycan hydrolase-like protein with peptidoglycan-binding domain
LAADPPKPVAKQAVKQVPSKQATAKPLAKPAVAKSSPTKSTYAKAAPAKSTVIVKPGATKAPVWPRYYAQQQPAPERYKEIQQALADKGYFSGSPDGAWSATSTDALKRFQHDQNLNEDGKLDSLSIIALGLGPKRAPTNVEQPATK